MKKYDDILEQIEEVEEIIKDLTFEQAAKSLNGYNNDKTLFDYDYKDFASTINNENGRPVMGYNYDIYENGQVLETLTKEEIKEFSSERLYRVPLKLTFDGFAVVRAKDEEEAEEIALTWIRANLDHVSDGGCDQIINHEFDLHGYPELRDDESIDEFDDEDIEELRKC